VIAAALSVWSVGCLNPNQAQKTDAKTGEKTGEKTAATAPANPRQGRPNKASRPLPDFLNPKKQEEEKKQADAVKQADALKEKGKKTLAYWEKLKGVLPKPAALKDKPEMSVAVVRAAASAIEDLPTLGIDEEVVTYALGVSTMLRRGAAHAEQKKNPKLLADAFQETTGANPFEIADEAKAKTPSFKSPQQAQEAALALRAALTARYQTEFPRLALLP